MQIHSPPMELSVSAVNFSSNTGKIFFYYEWCFSHFDLTIFSYSVKDKLQHTRKIYSMDFGFVNISGFKFNVDSAEEKQIYGK